MHATESTSSHEGTGNAGGLQTCFNILTAFLGAGILALPATFGLIGFVGGTVGMIICASANIYTVQLQIDSKTKLGRPITNYAELGLSVLSDR